MMGVRGIGRMALVALLLALAGGVPGCEQEMEHGTTDARPPGDGGGSAGDAAPTADAGMMCPDAGPPGDAGMFDGGAGDGDGGLSDGGPPSCTPPDAGPDAGPGAGTRLRVRALRAAPAS